MTPKKYFQKFVAAVVERSGICRPTVEAVLPAVFDQIRYELSEGTLCVPVEGFGTFAVIDIPERERKYSYKRDVPEIRKLPRKKQLKFAPTRNLRRDVENGRFDPTRKSFSRHPKDPPARGRSHLKYNPRKKIYVAQVDKKPKNEQ